MKPVCRVTGSLWEANVKQLLCFKFMFYLAVQELSCVDKCKEKKKRNWQYLLSHFCNNQFAIIHP